MARKFRSLQGLTVRNCGLNEDDLRSLARANVAGKLPELRHLDISRNGLKKSLELLTKDPETDRKLSWKSVIWVNDNDDEVQYIINRLKMMGPPYNRLIK